MKFHSVLPIGFVFLLALPCRAADAPQHDAIKQYRAYVAAVRAGDAQAVQKLAVPVSKEVQAAQAVLIKLTILGERLRRETVAQFGPIDLKKEELWENFGQPSDEDLKDLRVKVHEEANVAQVLLKNPHTGNHDRTALMVRRNNQWFVPITLQLDEDDDKHPVREPDAEEREGMLKHGTKMSQEVEKILVRLQKKQFKSSAEVMQAYLDIIPADGQIDK
jgi:hypothetical protein